jgi:ADP-ribose pyrophosphatase
VTRSEAQIASQRVYAGRVISLDIDQVRFPDGSSGELEIVRHPGASAIVPLLSDLHGPDPQVLLIRQYRYAADGYLYEIPAGRLEAGEVPLDCAIRELKEETGCTAERMQPLVSMFTTPGFTDERIHFFVASELTRGESKPDIDEFAESVPMPFTRALEMIRTGEIQDTKTAFALLYVAGFQAGL